jgi:hypothetical protein
MPTGQQQTGGKKYGVLMVSVLMVSLWSLVYQALT